MRTRLNLIFIFLLATTFSSRAQKIIAMNDKAQVITGETEILLQGRLQGDGIELTFSVDLRKKCQYWFAETSVENGELSLTIIDCTDKIAGIRNLGAKILTAGNPDKAMLLYYALSEIINEPYKNVPEKKENVANAEPAASPEQIPVPSGRIVTPIDPGQHRTRYFFAPSSYNLEKGELYYNSVYFLVHDIQYGITDMFSLGMGTTVAAFPFYITPKYTIPYSEKGRFAIGDILMLGTWNKDFFGNLLYLTFTHGDARNNITLGGGYLYTNEGSQTGNTNAPVVNFSALGQLSDHIYFLTENYVSSINTKQHWNNWAGTDVTFDQSARFLYGLIGFRFINRQRDVVSWQIGLTYVFSSYGDVPSQYKNQYWDNYNRDNRNFFTFPVIGFTRKFGARY